MKGFKDYRKLTMVGVRFGVDHCSFGIHSVIKSRKDRVKTSCWCHFVWQRRSDGETSSPSREKRVAQASLGERTRKLTPTKGQIRAGRWQVGGIRIQQRDKGTKTPESSGNSDPVGFPEQRGVLGR